VAGESLEDLIAAFSSVFAQSVVPPGTARCDSAHASPDVGYPLRRALMRVEAELLLADAALLSATAGEPRTPEQRRYDTFVALGERLAEAVTPT